MTRVVRTTSLLLVVLAVSCVLEACGTSPPASAPNAARANELIVSVRAEPESFNPYIGRGSSTRLVSLLTTAKLVRVNQVTQELEPWLAESWTRLDEGRRYRVKLRPNVTFADGQAFSAADVLFSLKAAYDGSGSDLGDSLQVSGKRLTIKEIDPLTVDVGFPSPFAPALRLLDNLPILPHHKLDASFDGGSFKSSWGLMTPPEQITGLGPFVLSEYVPGVRVVFVKNARYFRKDDEGHALPYLDRIICRIIPNQETELLQLDSGAIDLTLTEIPLANYSIVKAAADAGRLQLVNVGAAYDPDSLWFNLKPGAFGADPRAQWLQREELRQAISLGIDRKRFADTVYLGEAVPVSGPITPANAKWYSPASTDTAYKPARARELLRSIGLRDSNEDGHLEDASGAPARFTILTQKGQVTLERGASVIRDELDKIGLTVDVAPMDPNTVVQTFLRATGYDAVFFHVGTSDTDPAINPDFWLSSGSAHFWHVLQPPDARRTEPAPWERRIDELMARQMASGDEAERKSLFDQVQAIFAEHRPVLYFAVPKVVVAASSRVTNLSPAVSFPQLLWSVDTLAVRH